MTLATLLPIQRPCISRSFFLLLSQLRLLTPRLATPRPMLQCSLPASAPASHWALTVLAAQSLTFLATAHRPIMHRSMPLRCRAQLRTAQQLRLRVCAHSISTFSFPFPFPFLFPFSGQARNSIRGAKSIPRCRII